MSDLPPLPVGAVYTRALGTVGASMYTYTADQMREYALAAIAAEREACAKVCEEIEDSADAMWEMLTDPTEQGRSIGAQHCAQAIRAR